MKILTNKKFNAMEKKYFELENICNGLLKDKSILIYQHKIALEIFQNVIEQEAREEMILCFKEQGRI